MSVVNDKNFLRKWYVLKSLRSMKKANMSNKNLKMYVGLDKVLKNYVASKLIKNVNSYVTRKNNASYKRRRTGGAIHVNTLGNALSRHIPMNQGGGLRTQNNFERTYTAYTHGKHKNRNLPRIIKHGRMINYIQSRNNHTNENFLSPNVHRTAKSIYTSKNSFARRRAGRIIKNRMREHLIKQKTARYSKILSNKLGATPIPQGLSYTYIPQGILNKIAGMAAR